MSTFVTFILNTGVLTNLEIFAVGFLASLNLCTFYILYLLSYILKLSVLT